MMMNTINHNHHHHHSSHNGSSSNFPDKMQRTQDYVEALEEERKKILVFQRELPLCLELVTQAIETCKHQLCGTISECNFHGGQSECSEQTSTEGPVLEEFIPLKRTSFSDDEDEQEHSRKSKRSNSNVSKKSDWLRSVQLWNQTPDPPKTSEISPKRVAVTEVKRNSGGGGAFHPFMREKSVAGEDKTAAAKPETPPKNNCGGDRTTLGQVAEASSTADTGGSTGGGNGNGNGNGKKEEKDGQSSSSQRKSRRCWSPELHKRFLSSLHQLGGAHVATPKQIRELMKVDGLTNDEVKSHLQKYRLHTRRPSPTIHNNMSNPQAPQFVVVGGIWVPPPPEYAAMTAATGSGEACGGGGSSNGIYAPIAALPPPFQDPSARGKERKSGNDECGSHSGGGGGGGASHSPTSSAATDTTTTSPHY